MTAAHPESVVGRLRAASAALQAELSIPGSIHRREVAECVEVKNRALRLHAPALLAALEKVWAFIEETRAQTEPEVPDESLCLDWRSAREIVAPLFLAPETPSHD